MMEIKQVLEDNEKQDIIRYVLERLTEWFGISEAREEYIRDSVGKICFAAYHENDPIGFIYLKETGKDTAELAAMGILMEYHRKGCGRKLFDCARNASYEQGYSFLQVKTVQMGIYEAYDKTNLFYHSLGFKEFEILPTLWDEWNPCQIYIMALR